MQRRSKESSQPVCKFDAKVLIEERDSTRRIGRCRVRLRQVCVLQKGFTFSQPWRHEFRITMNKLIKNWKIKSIYRHGQLPVLSSERPICLWQCNYIKDCWIVSHGVQAVVLCQTGVNLEPCEIAEAVDALKCSRSLTRRFKRILILGVYPLHVDYRFRSPVSLGEKAFIWFDNTVQGRSHIFDTNGTTMFKVQSHF